MAQEVQPDPATPQPGNEDPRGICLRLAPRAGGESSIDFLRCGLRPSLWKPIDNPAAATINAAESSHFEWTMSWKGAMTIEQLALEIIRITGSNSEILYAQRRAGDIKKSQASINRLLASGFGSKYSLAQG